MRLFFCLFLLLFVIVGCSNSGQTVEEVFEDYNENYMDEKLSVNLNLYKLRSKLSDVYSTRSNEIPKGFDRIKVEENKTVNLYEGYRIQIYSGQSVVNADSISAQFRTWADTTLTGYTPQTYTFFRTPYYRVHVGDFHNHERAVSFSNIVKRSFPGAWVVHDRVDPTHVPADSLHFDLN